MKGNYFKKVVLYRLIFLALVIGCIFLYRRSLTDYVILISIGIAFLGIFAISDVDVTGSQVKIRKHYFWALVGLQWSIDFQRVTSLESKQYEVEPHQDAGLFTESLLSFFVFDVFKPKVTWLTTKLSYLDKGIERNIELKMSKGDFREIDRRIKHRSAYGQF